MLHLNQFQKPNVYPDNGYLGQDVAETDTLIVSLPPLLFLLCQVQTSAVNPQGYQESAHQQDSF